MQNAFLRSKIQYFDMISSTNGHFIPVNVISVHIGVSAELVQDYNSAGKSHYITLKCIQTHIEMLAKAIEHKS